MTTPVPDTTVPQRRPPGVDRPGRDRAALPALFHGPHGAEPGRALAQRRLAAQQYTAAVDRGYLRILVAGSLITMGTLGDRIGRRRLLLIGAAAFGVASVLAAFATSAAMLIAARAVLGVAGATLAPSTLSLIRNTECYFGCSNRWCGIGGSAHSSNPIQVLGVE